MMLACNPRIVTKRDVDRAIERWLTAIAAASSCRSISEVIETHARLGCRVDGGRLSVDLRMVGLLDAERAIARCTWRERVVLWLRYWDLAERVVEDDLVDGVLITRTHWHYPTYATIARKTGLLATQASPQQVRLAEATIHQRLTRARRKVREALECKRVSDV
jgi:hypothetical protein